MPEIPLWLGIVGPVLGYAAALLIRRSNRESTIVARWNVAEDELRLKNQELQAAYDRIDALRADREKIRDEKHADNERLQEAQNELIKFYERKAADTALEHQKEVDEMRRSCDVQCTELAVKLKQCEDRHGR